MNDELMKVKIRDFVENMKENGDTFASIRNLKKDSESVKILEDEIKNLINYSILMEGTTLDFYQKNVDEIEVIYNQSMKMLENSSLIKNNKKDNEIIPSTHKKDSWPLYKAKLKENGFSDVSIQNIGHDANKIVRRLDTERHDGGEPVKGLVVGSIQSGKTANMTALIAQCADAGWNCFIIISGMIESLRKQTENRIRSDLFTPPGNNQWNSLYRIFEKGESGDEEIRQLFVANRQKSSSSKYICVVLKNKTRLQNINQWLKRGGEMSKKLKVLIIDDECDQGSINTKPIEAKERTAIYEQITNLVNIHANGSLWGAINYVSYTATPYANILNDCSNESLYPRDFIATITPNKLYFGPNQLFGIKEKGYDGLSIIREIPQNDVVLFEEILKSSLKTMPTSLEKSIYWFACAVSIMRYQGYSNPISMLINVSPKINEHTIIEDLINSWLSNIENEKFIKNCEITYNQEIARFNKKILKSEYSDYEAFDKVKDYPSFNDIKIYLDELISCGPTRIKLDENERYVYSRNIHLCIDNSEPFSNDFSEENEVLRLLYPSSKCDKNPNPAFIVIGGNTLSRGLTIEGLVSTYFLRKGRQADTLMQMGRWFGYRRGYELCPRIWMDSDAIEKFEFLSQLDYDLRNDLKKYMDTGCSPLDVGPLINNTPAISWLRIAAKNKSQKAIPAEFNFIGYQMQTTIFSKNEEIQLKNLNTTREFLEGLGCSSISRTGKSRVWKNVDLDSISSFVYKFHFYNKSNVFDDTSIFKKWLMEALENNIEDVSKWNVVLAGLRPRDTKNAKWFFDNKKDYIYKVARTTKIDPNICSYYDIGVLRSYEDNYEDVIESEIINKYSKDIESTIRNQKGNFYEFKTKIGIDTKPMIVIYVIDKDSSSSSKSEGKTKRYNLNSKNDLIGIYLTIPGNPKNKSYSYKLTIDLEENFVEESVE